jgi:hypothetical protein
MSTFHVREQDRHRAVGSGGRSHVRPVIANAAFDRLDSGGQRMADRILIADADGSVILHDAPVSALDGEGHRQADSYFATDAELECDVIRGPADIAEGEGPEVVRHHLRTFHFRDLDHHHFDAGRAVPELLRIGADIGCMCTCGEHLRECLHILRAPCPVQSADERSQLLGRNDLSHERAKPTSPP